MKILKEKFPYRFVESDDRSSGWIEKFNDMTRRYYKFYECDSPLQLLTAIDDHDYVLWLDGQPCYRQRRGNSIQSPYKN